MDVQPITGQACSPDVTRSFLASAGPGWNPGAALCGSTGTLPVGTYGIMDERRWPPRSTPAGGGGLWRRTTSQRSRDFRSHSIPFWDRWECRSSWSVPITLPSSWPWSQMFRLLQMFPFHLALPVGSGFLTFLTLRSVAPTLLRGGGARTRGQDSLGPDDDLHGDHVEHLSDAQGPRIRKQLRSHPGGQIPDPLGCVRVHQLDLEERVPSGGAGPRGRGFGNLQTFRGTNSCSSLFHEREGEQLSQDSGSGSSGQDAVGE